MNPELSIILKKGHSYISHGNIFSKSLIYNAQYLEYKKIIIIVDNDTLLRQYTKYLESLGLGVNTLITESNLVDLIHSEEGIFLVNNYMLTDTVIDRKQLEYKVLDLESGKDYEITKIIEKLSTLGYIYSEFLIDGSYKKTGDVLVIVDKCGVYQYRLSFWEETLEDILKIDNQKQGTQLKINKLLLGSDNSIFVEGGKDSSQKAKLLDYISECKSLVLLDQLDFSENYDMYEQKLENFCSLDFIGKNERIVRDLKIENIQLESIEDLKELFSDKKLDIRIYTKKESTIQNFIEYNSLRGQKVLEVRHSLYKSFRYGDTVMLCDDILSTIFVKKRLQRSMSADLDLLVKIVPGDYVVHIDHGIGKFVGIVKKDLPGGQGRKTITKEYIEIAYKGEDKLFVPITEVARVNKFIGADHPKLTSLSTTEWQKKLQKVDESIQQLAEELLEIYSKRQMQKSFEFLPNREKEGDFRSSFPYNYTSDQEQAIGEILDDMEQEQPMDRLLVGDVGFGKTEVAFNAIYRSFINNKQSVLISPLVVLAYEHYESSVERFSAFGMNIAVLTRLESQSKMNNVIAELASGKIDLIIGTHKLLSPKIHYKSLGLLIVDEEHKFGVNDKEAIKKIKATVDVLSMSATPIPRSLNMALAQIRKISLIKTPPFGRKDIMTTISKFSQKVIADGCQREFDRNGQVYFVHNRVQTLVHFEKVLKKLFPKRKIIITHGQLPGDRLEKRIIDFKNKKYDILLTTTVIENGIDFANVNTIFINDAQNFGISQIHQLRGRVGRSERQGYCYLMYKRDGLSPETAERLKTIVNYSYLGAGFELAMKDLEIRGGGDLLGCRQSGQSSEIGVNLYLQMIEQKIHELRHNNLNQNNEAKEKTNNPIFNENIKIELNINIGIPDEYFDSELDKINFYREIESLRSLEDLDSLIVEFSESIDMSTITRQESIDLGDKKGKDLPEEMKTFFEILRIKIFMQQHMLVHVKKLAAYYQIDFSSTSNLEDVKKFLDLDKEVKFVVISDKRLRSPVKDFTNEQNFLKYLLKLFEKKITRRKITLKQKNS